MALFSKEYFQSQGLKFEGDFSYLDEFKKLKKGEQYLEICVGFGLYGVCNANNEAWLLIGNSGNKVEYFSFMSGLTSSPVSH